MTSTEDICQMNPMRFLDGVHESSAAMHSAHDPMLVVGSVFVAVLAAYAAIGLADQRRAAANTATKTVWLAIGSLAMGAGVWAMHFSAMLAHALPTPVRYDVAITALSVLPAIIAARCRAQRNECRASRLEAHRARRDRHGSRDRDNALHRDGGNAP
jgi:hypothetical protein